MTRQHARARSTALVVALACAACAACAAPVSPDLLVVNARVFTNDPARPWAEAIAIKGERVVAVGDSTVLRASAGSGTRVIEAGGRVVVPGFNDARVDLPTGTAPTPAMLTALDRGAISQGVTSVQVVAGGPMAALVAAARQAQRQARWRLIRSPGDGERPRDDKPFLPPQPGVRLSADGVSWTLGSWWTRRPIEPAQLDLAVKWAYGAEDPLVVALRGDVSDWVGGGPAAPDDLNAYLAARDRVGVAGVWQRKRPRLDIYGRVPVDASANVAGGPPSPAAVTAMMARLREAGVVVTVIPRRSEDQRYFKHAEDRSEPIAYEAEGLTVALGSGGGRSLVAAIADVQDEGEPSRAATIKAATWGSAYAEKAERDKGWLGPGTLADLAILSDDLFTAPAERISAITSVLTIVGGTVVYDAGVITK